MTVEEHFSAGGVVYRLVEGRAEIVLCGRDSPPLWSLPKGTPDPGETEEQTALREVREETGLETAVCGDLGQIEYWFWQGRTRVHKRVRFYLMSATGGSTDKHDPEFDRVAWFAAQEALKVMSYPNEAVMVKKALEKVQSA